ncbi:MAG TPA: endonuclease NucS domain-containing protein [Pirellulales bacterium]|nr:endonuclease NucS domain-containing protein [Pirellulales bacterium]
MATTWQVDFLDRLVAASHAAKDRRLATARLHRRKQTAGFSHPLVRSLECLFDTNRVSGNAQSQVLLIRCGLARGTHLDLAHFVVQLAERGLGGDARTDEGQLLVQHRWGYGHDEAFPVHEPRRVTELMGWAQETLVVLFDHLEERHQLLAPATGISAVPTAPAARALALERYLEDLLIEDWKDLDWGAPLVFLARQQRCGELGVLDILARDPSTGELVAIELKRDRSDDEVVGQVSRYMGWLMEHRAAEEGVGVRGIIVVREVTPKLRAAALAHESIGLFTYELGVTVRRWGQDG